MQILTLGVLILSYNVCYILIDNNIMGGINVTNSNNLKMFRLNKRLSQKQLADKTGLSISSIAKIEQGVRNPSYKAADKICVVLDAPLEEVFPSYKRECPYPRTM
jgi:transcriptional regulator with XRE-family HTH domain